MKWQCQKMWKCVDDHMIFTCFPVSIMLSQPPGSSKAITMGFHWMEVRDEPECSPWQVLYCQIGVTALSHTGRWIEVVRLSNFLYPISGGVCPPFKMVKDTSQHAIHCCLVYLWKNYWCDWDVRAKHVIGYVLLYCGVKYIFRCVCMHVSYIFDT